MRNIIFTINLCMLSFLFVQCSKEEEVQIKDNRSELDKLIVSGFKMRLEQVYVMSCENSIPYLDKPADSCFLNNSGNVTIGNFSLFEKSQTVLFGMQKGEIWNVSKMVTIVDTTYVESGFGDGYELSKTTKSTVYNKISCVNDYISREYIIQIYVGNVYNERGHDNHTFKVIVLNNDTLFLTNLYFSVLTKDQKGIFDGGYIYFDTNNVYQVAYNISEPLTSSKAKIEIEKGNYETYLRNGKTYYRIGNHLYMPRYNSYIYVGDVDTSGAVMYLKSTYYRLKFKII